jgi:hypothetical protein
LLLLGLLAGGGVLATALAARRNRPNGGGFAGSKPVCWMAQEWQADSSFFC